MDFKVNLLGVAAALVCVTGAGAETYRDAVHGWSIDLPPGWVAATPEAVRAMDDQVGSAFKNAKPFTYIASFGRSKNATQNPPYVIMQFTPADLSNASREDLEKAFQAVSSADFGLQASAATTGNVSDALKNAKVGSAILDPMNRVLMTIELPGPPAIKGRQVGLIAKDGIIQMNWFDLAQSPVGTPAEFEAMVASFRLDPDRAWVPGKGGGVMSGALSGAARGAIIGAAVGLCFALFRKFKGKPKAG